MKKNKGVTLLILIITIIIMTIILGITISAGTDLIRNTQKNRIITNLYLIQARATILLDNYLFDKDETALNTISNTEIGNQLGGVYLGIDKASLISKMGFKNINPSNKTSHIYCQWNEADLKNQGIDTSNITQGESFIIDYNLEKMEVDVASVKGYKDSKGREYHLLSEFKDE